MTDQNIIRLSVIIASYNSSQTIGECLASLESASWRDDVEVIVVDSSTDRTSDIVRRQFPWVKLLSFSERKFPGDARNIGVMNARGEIIAFPDADCIVAPDWLSEVKCAHATYPDPVIGGVIDNANPENAIGWANYFCEFSPYAPQTRPRRMFALPCGCTMKRWAFERFGPYVEQTYSSDTLFHWHLEQAGYQALFLPNIRVAHINLYSFNSLMRKKLMHGRSFARLRIGEKHFSIWRRSLYLLLFPLMPLFLYARVATSVFKNRIYCREFAQHSPIVFAGLAAWSTGECLAYLSGR